jgi:hypothetical protein
MKNALLFMTFFAVGSLLACSQQDQTPAKLLAAAREQSDIFNHASRPFLLQADLTVQLATPVQGRLTIHWQSKNHWRREMEFGHYKETVVRVGEWEYAQRNVGFAPLRATQVVSLLEFAKQDAHIAARNAKTRVSKGMILTCMSLESTGSNGQHELCTDSTTHEILSYDPWPYGLGGGSADFSGYAGIEEMRFPKHLEMRMGKGPAVTVNVTKLENDAIDANLLAPPPGSTERRYCEAMSAPVVIQKPDVASLGRFSEDVHVKFQVTVLTDGSVGAIQVIGQNSAEAADRIRKAWKDARYKPAMCGNEPVVADEHVGLDLVH